MRGLQKSFVFLLVLLLCLPIGLKFFPFYKPLPLQGVSMQAAKPAFSWHDFLKGDFQQNAVAFFNQHFALRSEYTKLTNQLYYTFFHMSYMYDGNLIIGKENYIYEKLYLDDYTETQNMSDERLVTLADEIRDVQQLFEKHHKKFFLLITPSKAKTLPEFVPDAYQPWMQNQQLPYDRWVGFLQKNQVTYIDGQEVFFQARKEHSPMLFTKGGTHWNEYGVSLMIKEMVSFMQQKDGYAISMPVYKDIRIDQNPQGTDRDLYDLLNLFEEPRYQAEHPVWKFAPAYGQAYSVAFIGGSFCWGMVDFMQQMKVFDPIDVYYYYSLGHTNFSKGEKTEQPLLSDLPAGQWKQEILSHDVIFFEVNAAMTPKALDVLEKFLKTAQQCM